MFKIEVDQPDESDLEVGEDDSIGALLLRNKEFSDIKFELINNGVGTEIKAHKAIMALCCTTCKDAFKDWENCVKKKFNNLKMRHQKMRESMEKSQKTSLSSDSERVQSECSQSAVIDCDEDEFLKKLNQPQKIKLKCIDPKSMRKFLKFCYLGRLSMEELEKYESDLFSLGDRLGCCKIFEELDKIPVKLPIQISTSLKALLNPQAPDEIKQAALDLFQMKSGNILSKLNLGCNKKRIHKNIKKFEELLQLDELSLDESTILDIILELPKIIGIKRRKEQKKFVDRLIDCVRWTRVGMKGYIKAYQSDLVRHDIIQENVVSCIKRSAVGGEYYGQYGLPRCTFKSVNSEISTVKHNLKIFVYSEFAKENRKAFKFHSNPKPGEMVCFQFRRDFKMAKVRIISQGYADAMISIEGSHDEKNWTRMSILRHTKDSCEIEWPPKYQFRYWKISTIEGPNMKCWFSYVEWFVKSLDFVEDPTFEPENDRDRDNTEIDSGEEQDQEDDEDNQNNQTDQDQGQDQDEQKEPEEDIEADDERNDQSDSNQVPPKNDKEGGENK
ncbi:unnamed protein product [Moneuplotes crassus]|uniref:BTB domain-containing protein n=1 Tax=Euplotes crassus TaxID=5936 RepID=A0AAD1Y894_EUPCR|nr:unnamed protein product [Moneuplotes crassus]